MAVEVETPVSGEPAATLETTPAPEIDYKAEFERTKAEAEGLKQERVKLEQQLRSTQGALRRPLDIEAALQRNTRETTRLREKFDLIADAQLEGDERYAALKARHQQEDSQDSSDAALRDKIKDIRAEVAEAYDLEYDRVNETPEVAAEIDKLITSRPELKGIYDLTLQGWNSRDRQILQQAHNSAAKVRSQAWQKKVLAGREEAKKEAEEAAQERMRESGVLTMPNPKAAGIRGQNWEAIRNAYIANPYDPAVAKAYTEARRAKGL